MTSTLSTAIQSYYQARQAAEDANATAKEATRVKEEAERILIDAMADEGISSVKQEDGTTVSLRKRFTCSVTKGNVDLIREWLVKSVGDDKDFVVETVDKEALTEFLKGRDGEAFPEFLNVNTQPIVSVIGWRSREAD